jgi:hypothetical protein
MATQIEVVDEIEWRLNSDKLAEIETIQVRVTTVYSST